MMTTHVTHNTSFCTYTTQDENGGLRPPFVIQLLDHVASLVITCEADGGGAVACGTSKSAVEHAHHYKSQGDLFALLPIIAKKLAETGHANPDQLE